MTIHPWNQSRIQVKTTPYKVVLTNYKYKMLNTCLHIHPLHFRIPYMHLWRQLQLSLCEKVSIRFASFFLILLYGTARAPSGCITGIIGEQPVRSPATNSWLNWDLDSDWPSRTLALLLLWSCGFNLGLIVLLEKHIFFQVAGLLQDCTATLGLTYILLRSFYPLPS